MAKPYHRAMIKIQLLLRRPASQPELEAGLRDKLEQLGIHVLGAGRVTVTAELSPAAFEKLFGLEPASACSPGSSPDLPIPDILKDVVTLITVAPAHVLTGTTGKGTNAAI